MSCTRHVIRPGAPLEIAISVKAGGAPYDLTGCTLTGAAAEYPGGETVETFAVEVIDAAEGSAMARLTAEQTEGLASYQGKVLHGEFWMEDADGKLWQLKQVRLPVENTIPNLTTT